MSYELSRAINVRAYGCQAGSIELIRGRWFATSADGAFLGSYSARAAAARALERDALAGLYAQHTQPTEPDLPPWWPKTFPARR